MDCRARTRSLCGATFALALAACGDWPWPLTNPDDPLRCSPACGAEEACRDGACVYSPCREDSCNAHGECVADEASKTFYCKCAKGFIGSDCSACAGGNLGYPDCHLDFCLGQTCSGHGTCAAERCTCDAAFGGVDCSACAPGYVGYPSCECTGQTDCSGTSLLEYCSGTTWSTLSCAGECVAYSWPSGFCASDPVTGKDLCTCSVNATDGAIDFRLTTTCTTTLTVSFHDQTTKTSIVQPTTLSSGSPVEVTIPCVPGHKICFGAWEPRYYWGCGENCAKACDTCCMTCPAANTIVKSAVYGTNLKCEL